jgi:hypothetical protein
MTTTEDLLDLTLAALIGPGCSTNPATFATSAEHRVYRPGDWPIWDQQYPATKLRVLSEDMQTDGKGGLIFTVNATVRIISQVSAPASDEDGGGAAAEAALWKLARQNMTAVVNSYPLTGKLQQIPFIRSALTFTSDGETHLAGIQTDIGMQFMQSEEDFAPLASAPLEEISAEVTNLTGVGLTISLSQ